MSFCLSHTSSRSTPILSKSCFSSRNSFYMTERQAKWSQKLDSGAFGVSRFSHPPFLIPPSCGRSFLKCLRLIFFLFKIHPVSRTSFLPSQIVCWFGDPPNLGVPSFTLSKLQFRFLSHTSLKSPRLLAFLRFPIFRVCLPLIRLRSNLHLHKFFSP